MTNVQTSKHTVTALLVVTFATLCFTAHAEAKVKSKQKRKTTAPIESIASEEAGSIPNTNRSKNRESLRSDTPVVTKLNADFKMTSEPTRRWEVKYRTYNAMDISAVSGVPGSDTEIRAYDRFNLTYKLTNSAKVSVMPQWYHTWFGDRERPQDASRDGYTQPFTSYMGNTAFIISEAKLLDMGRGFMMDGYLRYDAPTSEDSQKANSYGETWTNIEIEKPIGIAVVRWSEIFRYFHQGNYTSSIVDRSSKLEVQNLEYRLYTLFDFGLQITPEFSILLETGLISDSKYGDGQTARPSSYVTSLVMNPEMTYEFNKNIGLSLGFFELKKTNAIETEGYIPLSYSNGGEAYMMLTVKI